LECLIWPYPTTKAYPTIKIDGKFWSFHRYVCQLTHGDPPTKEHEAAHTCGNSLCVNKRHIVWKTHSENLADRVLHGTAPIGERHFNSKLTGDRVREIRRIGRAVDLKTLGEMFDVDGSTIGKILSGKAWAHVKDEG